MNPLKIRATNYRTFEAIIPARIACALAGHRWDWRAVRGTDDPYRCERCGHYDDEPKIVRAAKRRARLNYWSPLTFKVTRRETWLRIGTPHHHRIPQIAALLELHYGFERTGELPGVSVRLDVWRLDMGLHVGGGWQDEDGNGRALFHLWADFETYGLRWIGCWLGHKPEQPFGSESSTYCARCDEHLAKGESN